MKSLVKKIQEVQNFNIFNILNIKRYISLKLNYFWTSCSIYFFKYIKVNEIIIKLFQNYPFISYNLI